MLESKRIFGRKNYNLIEEHNFFEELELMVTNFVGVGWIFVLVEVWVG
jgi:hypothetical protein